MAEEGGFILETESGEKEYRFVQITNCSPSETASVLYTADVRQFGKEVLGPCIDDKLRIFASIHTHPGLSTSPSTTDLSRLFTSFSINYIYSPKAKLISEYKLVDMKNLENKQTAALIDIKLYPSFSKTEWANYMWHRTDIHI